MKAERMGAWTRRTWERATLSRRVEMAARLRARYFEARELGERAREQVRAAAEYAEPVEPIELAGMTVSSHPAGAWRALRVVASAELPESERARFALPGNARFSAVFVNPRELDFRTFEGVLGLDDWFDGIECAAGPARALAQDVYVFGVRGPEEVLGVVDAAGLYVEPVNASQRGGRRMIFHAAPLADALGEALRKRLPEPMREGFVGVNPVFRASRFEPGDAPFAAHMDAPYRDPARGHVSKYTVLLYITGGSAPGGALSVEGVDLGPIEAMTCVVFHQRFEHEGRPYREGEKVFLRSELIYADDGVVESPELGRMFARATYLTGECVFAPELARHEYDAYDRVARARWEGRLPEPPATEPFMHKTYGAFGFVTNGYDYWVRCEGLEDAATLALLDHFNARVDGARFRESCEARVVEGAPTMEWVPELLARQSARPRFVRGLDKTDLFPEPGPPSTDEEKSFPFDLSEFTSPSDVIDDLTRHPDVLEVFEERQAQAKARVLPAAFFMMGQEVFLDASRFVVEGERLHVLTDVRPEPVHFAAMSIITYEAEDAVGVDRTLELPYLLVPPILFRRVGECWHLRFDFFRNTWMVRHEDASVEVPLIKDELTFADGTW